MFPLYLFRFGFHIIIYAKDTNNFLLIFQFLISIKIFNLYFICILLIALCRWRYTEINYFNILHRYQFNSVNIFKFFIFFIANIFISNRATAILHKINFFGYISFRFIHFAKLFNGFINAIIFSFSANKYFIVIFNFFYPTVVILIFAIRYNFGFYSAIHFGKFIQSFLITPANRFLRFTTY